MKEHVRLPSPRLPTSFIIAGRRQPLAASCQAVIAPTGATTDRNGRRTTMANGMALYFKNKRPKTFLGAPVGWPLMFVMAIDLCIAGLMVLSDHDWAALILLYPPLALAIALLVDARKEKLAARQRRR